VLTEVCAAYRRELMDAGSNELVDRPFGFATLPGGGPIYDCVRTVYTMDLRDAEEDGGQQPPDPFTPAHAGEFRAWAHASFADKGFHVPDQLSDRPRHPAPKSRSARLRSRVRRLVVASDRGAEQRPAIDCLAALKLGPPPRRVPAGPEGDAGEETVLAGPAGWLDSGRYRVTVEYVPGPRRPGLSDHDQAIVVEVETEGYLLEARTATVGQVESEATVVEFTVPPDLVRQSLSSGVQLWVRSRVRVEGTFSAVLVQRVSRASHPPLPVRRDWLPIMDAGPAGRRAGLEVNARSEAVGLVLSGPDWRLPAGSYLARIRTRVEGDGGPTEGHDGGAPSFVAVMEVVVEGVVLWKRPLERQELAGGTTMLPFDISGPHAERGAYVAVRIRTKQAVAMVVEAVEVEQLAAVAA
jgi:hypothetical protein